MHAFRRASLLAAFAVLAVLPGFARGQELRYEGSHTIAENILVTAVPAFEAKSPGVKVKVSAASSGKGFKALMAGGADVAGVSRSLTPEELAQRPYFQTIGYDAVGVFVNEKGNTVKALSKAQLKDLFTGKVKNWKDVGGPNLAVVLCAEPVGKGFATIEMFQSTVLEGAAFGPTVEHEQELCVKLVASTPGAVVPASMAYAAPGVRPVPLDGAMPSADDVRAGNYLLSRPLLLVAKARPAGAAKAFFDFMLSPAGQGFVAKDFVSVR